MSIKIHGQSSYFIQGNQVAIKFPKIINNRSQNLLSGTLKCQLWNLAYPMPNSSTHFLAASKKYGQCYGGSSYNSFTQTFPLNVKCSGKCFALVLLQYQQDQYKWIDFINLISESQKNGNETIPRAIRHYTAQKRNNTQNSQSLNKNSSKKNTANLEYNYSQPKRHQTNKTQNKYYLNEKSITYGSTSQRKENNFHDKGNLKSTVNYKKYQWECDPQFYQYLEKITPPVKNIKQLKTDKYFYPKKQQINNSKSNFNCILCEDKQKNCGNDYCGHVVSCMQCSVKLTSCPMCKKPFKAKKLYF